MLYITAETVCNMSQHRQQLAVLQHVACAHCSVLVPSVRVAISAVSPRHSYWLSKLLCVCDIVLGRARPGCVGKCCEQHQDDQRCSCSRHFRSSANSPEGCKERQGNGADTASAVSAAAYPCTASRGPKPASTAAQAPSQSARWATTGLLVQGDQLAVRHDLALSFRSSVTLVWYSCTD